MGNSSDCNCFRVIYDISSRKNSRNIRFKSNLIHFNLISFLLEIKFSCLVNQLETQRDAVSAVSLDEEMTNMVRFQYSYMAAAKIITTSSEMIDALIRSV